MYELTSAKVNIYHLLKKPHDKRDRFYTHNKSWVQRIIVKKPLVKITHQAYIYHRAKKNKKFYICRTLKKRSFKNA